MASVTVVASGKDTIDDIGGYSTCSDAVACDTRSKRGSYSSTPGLALTSTRKDS